MAATGGAIAPGTIKHQLPPRRCNTAVAIMRKKVLQYDFPKSDLTSAAADRFAMMAFMNESLRPFHFLRQYS